MGLTSALQIGRTALNASQVAIQVTGNNFANAATPGYSRQIAHMGPSADARTQGGFSTGGGVRITGINRQIDQALQSRLWAGTSQESAAGIDLTLLSQVESTLNEMTDSDLSSELSAFFGSWSDLANSPNADGARALVVRQGGTLASHLRRLRSDLGSVRDQIDSQITASATRADQLLQQVADVNQSIANAEGTSGGSGEANSLRDQRDALITELSALLDVTTVVQPSGMMDVLVGSTPVVLGANNRGVESVRITSASGGGTRTVVRVKDDQQQLPLTAESGSLGALLTQRDSAVSSTIDRLDTLASQLIHEVNRVHSQGYAGVPLTSIRGTRQVGLSDVPTALNDPNNDSFSGLPFAATSGSFLVTVKNTATGATQTVRVSVDLDGLDSTGAAGFGDDSSVASIAAGVDGIDNLTASVNPDGTLSINAASGFQFSLSEDSSGALAVLGVNTYFTGDNAADIDVRDILKSQPGLLVAGGTVGGSSTDNSVALAITGLQDQANSNLGGQTVRGFWLDAVGDIGLRTDGARTRADATTLVRESLDAQRQAVSGVSVDEESVNLIQYQQQYQGAARFISVVQELTQTLLASI